MARVLVVEDNDLLGLSYQMILKHNGYHVALACNGQEGLQMFAQFKPNIILLDYLMPIMDGKQFLLAFEPSSHPKVKVVLLSNMDDPEKLEEAFELGIYSHLLKASLTPDQLVAHIRSILTRSRDK